MNNIALISIGSNCNPASSIFNSKRMLIEKFPIKRASAILTTHPVDNVGKFNFLNQLIEIETEKTLDFLLSACKQIEYEIGRRSNSKSIGQIVIDIDVISYNQKVLKPSDYKRPYMKALLESLA